MQTKTTNSEPSLALMYFILGIGVYQIPILLPQGQVYNVLGNLELCYIFKNTQTHICNASCFFGPGRQESQQMQLHLFTVD